MSRPLRVGGRTLLPDGATVLWSVAEGRRGRRWRAVTVQDGATTSDLLLEVGDDGRASRLELATASGLLTLHPGKDGASLHGNTVSMAGVRHHELPWSDDHILVVDGSTIAEAAVVGSVGGRLGVGEGGWFGSVVVDGALVPRVAQTLVVRAAADRFTIASPSSGDERTVALDQAGIPTTGVVATWDLEVG
jgi:hypothetical protein